MKSKLLISACLLGIPCRYDGRAKEGRFTERELALRDFLPVLEEKYELVPFCPEIYGGLTTPRPPSERVGDRVLTKDGRDVTEQYERGATLALSLCRTLGIERALMKAKSPACGVGYIYDGTHTGTLTEGDGVAAELLLKNGILVVDEGHAHLLIK